MLNSGADAIYHQKPQRPTCLRYADTYHESEEASSVGSDGWRKSVGCPEQEGGGLAHIRRMYSRELPVDVICKPRYMSI